MSKGHYLLDKIKFNRWLNIRKTTIDQLNKDLKHKLNFEISFGNCENLDDYSIKIISEYLKILPSKLKKNKSIPIFLHRTKNEINKTKRPIIKDGIHFYNYYTLPTPKGYVSPVLLDILCPKEKLPKLNNGHLEPAITISMGPNDIYARFAEKLNKDTWLKFEVNKDPETKWVVGSSYYEPSFCKHSYSRVTNQPGRIISYTTRSNIESLTSGKLNNNSYKNILQSIKGKRINRVFLKLELESKGYSIKEISKKIKLSTVKLKNFFSKKNTKLDRKYIIKICSLINSDPNLFIDRSHKEDAVGKLYFDYRNSIKSIRKFKSYKVASIANSKRFPDLSGFFLKVSNLKNKTVLDLYDSKCSHYYVTGGKMKIHIKSDGKNLFRVIKNRDCLWMSAFTYHGFSGNGSILKISDGQNINYLEKEDLINTYSAENFLRRGKNDMMNWGYDK